jgi:eukaryotic-like serine/threonine-protein kinase
MSLKSGTRVGHYEILSLIGSGGMGEVYRARDTKLSRDIALKILPDTFASDIDRAARFQREARVLATLNHPNIGHIYGLEDSGTPQALVLELVDGPTLAERIDQGPITFDDALPIARQIATALEAAHELGIIHRDLKPANVKVRPDGTVKVLDFGLAKAFDPVAESAVEALNSPTLTARGTQMGVVLGTAAYMSPEQAKGKVVDRRADIWAFGAVLYEMLTGRRPFIGEDVSDTLAAVLRQDVDWSALPAETPAAVRRVIQRCLDRDVRRRLRDIGEARIVLEDPSVTAASSPTLRSADIAVSSDSNLPRPRWQRYAVVSAVLAAVTLLAGAAGWYLKPAPVPLITRFQFTPPPGVGFTSPARHFLNISSDGTQIVYVANNRLYLRKIGEPDSHPIPGTDGLGTLAAPAFSPDGGSVVFWSSDSTIRRVSLDGGAVVALCQSDGVFGMSWSQEGIVFAQGNLGTIMRVSPNGGTPEVIAKADAGEMVQGGQILPGGRHLIFTATSDPNTLARWDKARIMVQTLGTSERRTIVEGGSDARYLSTGHLLYAVGGVVFAAPFDASRAQRQGPGVPVVEGVRRGVPAATGAAQLAVSATGTLVYVPGPTIASFSAVDFGLADRKGNVKPLNLPHGAYAHPRVSPDGRHLAFDVASGQESFVALYDLAGTTAVRRLTLGGTSRFPVWTADGTRVAYQSDREGDSGIFWQRADGSGSAERLTKPAAGESHVPEAWSPVSNTLLYSVVKGPSEYTLWTLSLPDRITTSFGSIRSTIPINAVFRKDGRWIAYQTNQLGRSMVYVQPVPPTGSVYQVAAPAGDQPHEPLWSPDGRELFYNPRAGGFEVVSMTTDKGVAFGNPTAVPRAFQLNPPQGRRSYDITPGGLIVAVILPGTGDATTAAQFEVVVNWFQELKRRMSAK